MYRLKVKLRGFDIGTQPCENQSGDLEIKTANWHYWICDSGDIQTFIDCGIIEKLPEPEFTKNDMIEFLNFGLAQNEQPISSEERFKQFVNMIRK